MMNYTIADFWVPRLGEPGGIHSDSMVQGWSIKTSGLLTFQEAPLTLSDGFGADDDPMTSSVLLVSAPGAVGKSTLAGEIAAATSAVHIDLAVADQVGANFLAGGLFKSGVLKSPQSPIPALVIDGLDEARLKVTEGAFRTFLTEVAKLSETGNAPTVLFGRTRAVEEAWLVLKDASSNVAVLEIGFFNPKDALKFAHGKLRARKPDTSHESAEMEALELLLQQLGAQTESDGNRFAGYAPVLQAVADRVASESNAMRLATRLKQGGQAGHVTLQDVAFAILEREQGKLVDLPLDEQNLIGVLYRPEEQLARLVARVYGLTDPELPAMSQNDAQSYSNALETWVAEHPFLDGGFNPSSSVFDAMITATALRNAESSQSALQKELMKGVGPNPFLFTFYSNICNDDIRPEHIGVIYSSLRAGLSLGDTASLFVTEDDGEHGVVEILLGRHGADHMREFDFSTDNAGQIFLGPRIENVTIVAPLSAVEVGGHSAESTMTAPVSIQCHDLWISASSLVVEDSSRQAGDAVYLEAENCNSTTLSHVPLLRGHVKLYASWPEVSVHPWTNFATSRMIVPDIRIDEGLRRLKHFVIAFRSHGRGRLARYASKIDSTRMTKGTGQAVLDLMVKEGILSLEHPRYFLDQAKLAEVIGVTYHDCMAWHFGQQAVEFIQRALQGP